MLARLEEFWGYVQRKELPPVDASIATGQLLAKLWPQDNDTSILLPPESVEWDRELTEAKAQIKAADAVKVAAENKLKAALGENAIGDLPGGGSYSWKTQERAGYTVEPTTLRVLRRCK
jgi:predicted phage-related endonuclease